MISRKFNYAITALAFVLSAATASAHDSAKGPNGGPVAEVAGHHVEFVSTATDVTFVLSGSNHEPIASAGAKMRAIIQDGGQTAQIELVPVEPNKLVGKLSAPLGKGAKVVVTGTLSDGHSVQARFVAP